KDNRLTHVVKVPPQQMAGANSRQELANLERIMQEKLRDLHMTNGATLMDPTTTYFSYDTEVGKDVVIEPNVFFAPGVKVADNVHILANCHLEGTVVEEGASIGPFARTRPGTKVERKAVVGN